MHYLTQLTDRSILRAAELISMAFGSDLAGSESWLRTQSAADLRGVMVNDRLDACLRRIEMGQYFGGRDVPMIGIAGVAVAPEARGKGIARRLMTEAVREMHARREPLSTLYASTRTLYQQVGYEQAGHQWRVTLPLVQITTRQRAGEWHTVPHSEAGTLLPCYTAFASRFDGLLRRGQYVWDRVYKWRDKERAVYACRDDAGNIEAYLAFNQVHKDNGRISMEASDLAFASATGARRLLAFIHDFASMVDEITFTSGPMHPLLSYIEQMRYTVQLKEYWMLRIAHLEEALLQRGYSPAVDTELHMDLNDPIIPENAGRWILRVRGGTPGIERGGRGSLISSINAFASLYTGFASPHSLRLAGMIDCDDASAHAATALFASATPPWLIDFF